MADRRRIRAAALQLAFHPDADLDALLTRVEQHLAMAADWRVDLAVLPELFSLSLLAGQPTPIDASQAMTWLAERTPDLIGRLAERARAHDLTLVAGSHPVLKGDAPVNTGFLMTPDGAVHAQEKLHPTPDEKRAWGMVGGRGLSVMETPAGRVAVLVCYDVEFPELARQAALLGAEILCVPYLTDSRAGHLRVTLCARARAVENHVYVIAAGAIGMMRGVANMDASYAESGVYTPSDIGFAREGIAALAPAQDETPAIADLDLDALMRARAGGSVRPLDDRRTDLYETIWRGDAEAGA